MLPGPARLRRVTSAAGQLAGLLRNAATAQRFAATLDQHAVPHRAVALYFCTEPANLFQFEQWRRPLERLASARPVFVVVDRPDTGALLAARTTLPLAFAQGSGALEQLVVEHDVSVVAYVNQVERNFRMLRFPGPVHVQLGHGESDKTYSVSNQHRAYDLTFVGGRAGRDRLGSALRNFDVERCTRAVGRPQLDHDYPGAPDWPRDSGLRVLYAPTWEGDRPSVAYGSAASHGPALVAGLLADDRIRVIYRPHPRAGLSSPRHAAADRQIRALLHRAGGRHLVDTGPYGWQWGFADACVTDISSVGYDWLATQKPLVLTRPVAATAYRPRSRLLDELPLLPVEQAGSITDVLAERGLGGSVPTDGRLAELAHYYFGDTASGASSVRFAAAVESAYALQSDRSG